VQKRKVIQRQLSAPMPLSCATLRKTVGGQERSWHFDSNASESPKKKCLRGSSRDDANRGYGLRETRSKESATEEAGKLISLY